METKVLNYRVIIESDQRTGSQKSCFTAFCPTLGIADDGDTIEEALENIKSLIKFHVRCLLEEKQPIPVDKEDSILVTSVKISLPKVGHLATL